MSVFTQSSASVSQIRNVAADACKETACLKRVSYFSLHGKLRDSKRLVEQRKSLATRYASGHVGVWKKKNYGPLHGVCVNGATAPYN